MKKRIWKSAPSRDTFGLCPPLFRETTMLRLTRLFLVIAAAASAGTALAADPPAGFTSLFNGKDFTGWYGWRIHDRGGSPTDLAKLSPEEKAKKIADWTADMKANWRIENGAMINKGKGAYPATAKDYGDAEFLIEYKITATVDSGIYPKTMPQIQVWDPWSPDPDNKLGKAKGSGGMWNNPPGYGGKDPLVLADNKPGEWNQFRIIQLGDRITVYLNGKLVVDGERMHNYWDKGAPLPAKAPLLLQTHAPELEIHWRNLYVREIPAEEANAMLRKKLAGDFTSIFNGKDFAGWKGATENYEVADGSIRCKKGKGGVLFTEEVFDDFQIALDIKIPAGCNNGLGIRYPGTGDGAYSGMCELQVLDDSAAKYAKLDPRQYHGSAYGMAAAKRGFQRPVGEWNFQVVTVKGSSIVVELNGSRILDTDLSKITDYMAKSPHPGKELTKGHFGFLGHNDPVEFRNITVKRMPKSSATSN
jgi:hypothetical protein